MAYPGDVLIAALWAAIALSAIFFLIRALLRLFGRTFGFVPGVLLGIRFGFTTLLAMMLAASLVLGLNSTPQRLENRDSYGWPYRAFYVWHGREGEMMYGRATFEMSLNIITGIGMVVGVGALFEYFARRSKER